MIPAHLTDAVAEAERRLAPLQIRVCRPGATLEDEHALQCARTRLAIAQNKALQAENAALRKALRNKPQEPVQRRMTARERAEAEFQHMRVK